MPTIMFALGGYKGYGLSAMVELLCGISAGASWGPHIRHWKESDRFANLVIFLLFWL